MANLSSASEIYNMAPTRWGGILKTLNNKKAIDDLIRQHTWTMQQKSADAASGKEKEHIQGQYRLKEQELQNKSSGKSNLEYSVLTQAVEMAKAQGIDMQSPEGQQQFQQLYQALLHQASGGKSGAMMAAGGVPPDAFSGETQSSAPEPVGMFDPRRMSPNYADYGIPKATEKNKKLDQATAQKILQKAGGDKDKARAMAKKLGYSF